MNSKRVPTRDFLTQQEWVFKNGDILGAPRMSFVSDGTVSGYWNPNEAK